MLPFLKPKQTPGIIITTRKPDGGTETQGMEGDEDQGLIACSEDILQAIQSKDAKALASAIRAAFEICEAYPHEEGPHTEDESEE